MSIPSRTARIVATKQVADLLCRSWSRVKQVVPLRDFLWPCFGLALRWSVIGRQYTRQGERQWACVDIRQGCTHATAVSLAGAES